VHSNAQFNKDQAVKAVEVVVGVWHRGRFNRQVEVAQYPNTSAKKNDTRSKALRGLNVILTVWFVSIHDRTFSGYNTFEFEQILYPPPCAPADRDTAGR